MNYVPQSYMSEYLPRAMEKARRRIFRLTQVLRQRYGVYSTILYDEMLLSNVKPEQTEEVWNLIRNFKGDRRRKWRMVYGWRSNPVAATLHFHSAALYGQAAALAKHPLLRYRRLEAQYKGVEQMALGMSALCNKWVRVGKAHRWEVK